MGAETAPEALGSVLLRSGDTSARDALDDDDVESACGGLEDWGKLIGDVPAATAILDSLPHHAEIITIKGRSYRVKDRAAKAEAESEEAVVPGEREGRPPCRRKPK